MKIFLLSAGFYFWPQCGSFSFEYAHHGRTGHNHAIALELSQKTILFSFSEAVFWAGSSWSSLFYLSTQEFYNKTSGKDAGFTQYNQSSPCEQSWLFMSPWTFPSDDKHKQWRQLLLVLVHANKLQ